MSAETCRLAEQVQRSFLPDSVPKIPGYTFFAYYHAAYNVGGDYYDFVPLPGERLGIALADVSGKGIPAALMMAKFSGNTRYCILTENAPAPAVSILNDQLCDAGLEERFITLSLGVLDLAKGQLSLASAGHLPVIIRHAPTARSRRSVWRSPASRSELCRDSNINSERCNSNAETWLLSTLTASPTREARPTSFTTRRIHLDS